MPVSRTIRRSLGVALPVGLGLALIGPASALGAISGSLTTTAGAPVNTSVKIVDPAGDTVRTAFPDAQGKFSVELFSSTGPGPFTLTAATTDRCRDSDDPERERTVTSAPVVDGAVVDLKLDVRSLCAESFVPSTVAEPKGIAEGETGRIIGAPGGRVYLEVPTIPSGAEGVTFRLPDGRVIGGQVPGQRLLQVTLPKPAYNGPFQVTYTDEGLPVTWTVGTIVSRSVKRSPAFAGAFDLINIVDISGSMGGNDRGKRRADAIDLVLGLSNKGDKVGGIGFDTKPKVLFKLKPITTDARTKALARQARKRIVNRGGTDYDVGLTAAYEALTAPGVSQTRPKAAIFLTDGAHGGSYGNSHLRFAFNSTGRTWPICVVQLGTRFNKGDKARLKRIAKETGGIYVAAPSNAKLNEVYFKCRGTTSGDRTYGRKVLTVKKGQTKTLAKKLPAKLKKGTFFAGWTKGTHTVTLIDPKGKKTTVASAKKKKAIQARVGRNFTFFTVTNPRKGKWRIQVKPKKLSGATKVTTTMTGRKK